MTSSPPCDSSLTQRTCHWQARAPQLAVAVLVGLTLQLAGCTDAPDASARVSQARQQLAAGDPDTALTTLKLAARERTEDPEIRLLMADAYLATGRGDLAFVTLEQAQALGADARRTLLPRADALLLQKKYQEVLAIEPPEDWPELQRLLLRQRKAEALRRSTLNRRSQGNAVAAAYVDLFERIALSNEADAVAPVVAELEELRRSDPRVERAWQHFSCRGQPVETHAWQPLAVQPEAKIHRVGAGRKLRTPAAAARVAADGDIVEIDPGKYPGGVARWPQNHLLVRGAGERPVVTAAGQAIQGRDVWLFTGDQVTVENVEISGARSAQGNGAGIRHTGSGLTLRYVYLHDNQNGLLTGNRNPDSETLIEYSEFARNGEVRGQAHNIYIGRSGRFELRFSYSHESRTGHLVKSRATRNMIGYNRLSDNEDGRSSYLIDLPEGGQAEVIGNVLQQGYGTLNHGMISFGAEQLADTEHRLVVASNTIYNRDLGGIVVRNPKNLEVLLINNLLAGAPVTLVEGTVQQRGNQMRVEHGLADPRAFDFSLLAGADAIDSGLDEAPVPAYEYVHPLASRPRQRIGTLDIGAYEHCGL